MNLFYTMKEFINKEKEILYKFNEVLDCSPKLSLIMHCKQVVKFFNNQTTI